MAVVVFTADLVSKVLVVANIPEQTYVHVIGNVFMLTQVRNGGAAFNLGGTSITVVFTLIAAGVVTYILRAASNLRSTGWAIALGLLLGGATGNLIDRIFRAARPVPRRRGRLDRGDPLLAGVQRRRLLHRLRRHPGRPARPERHPPGRHPAPPAPNRPAAGFPRIE